MWRVIQWLAIAVMLDLNTGQEASICKFFCKQLPMPLEKYFSTGLEDRVYIEKTFKGTEEEYREALRQSRTIYVSGVCQNIREEQLWHLFSICGEVKRVIMGVNRSRLTFCGFLFVEFEHPDGADNSMALFRDFLLDGQLIKVDRDIGFSEGRQYGRGVFGGPMRNDNKRKRYN